MTDAEKRLRLFKYKAFATGLFLLMVVIFVIATILEKNSHSHFIGYIRAFTEAAMVGALADWFAVTALFHYPMGLRIPHTNLIAKSKQRIGDNLGNFVVENFLSAENIRPYIQKIKISEFLGRWLLKERNQQIVLKELFSILKNTVDGLDQKTVIDFISGKMSALSSSLNVSRLAAGALKYLDERHDLDSVITSISSRIKKYVLENQEIIIKEVSKESYFFVPKFVDKKIAEKISRGLVGFFSDIEENNLNPVRKEIQNQLQNLIVELETTNHWESKLEKIKESFLGEDKLQEYAIAIWNSIRDQIQKEISGESRELGNYLQKRMADLALDLSTDPDLQNRIDQWVRVNAYQFILRNASKVSELIRTTIGNWEEQKLSQKLELEVGKDLQYIRVNGTIVGGIVGLLIYTLTHFFV